MFIVPITLFSCARRADVVTESTTRRASTTVSIWAASTILLRSACCVPTRTNSVRSSGLVGSSESTPMLTSPSGSASSAWARRPPQYVDSPVTRTRFEPFIPATPPSRPGRSSEPHRLPRTQHVEQVLLDQRADVVGHGLHEALVVVE